MTALRLCLITMIGAFFLFSCSDDSSTEPIDDDDDNGGTNTLTGPGATYKLDGNLVSIDTVLIQPNNPVADYLIITLPTSIDMQLRMLPNEVGDYPVGSGPNQYRQVDVWYMGDSGSWYYANDSIGSGSISLSEIGILSPGSYAGHIKGTFEFTVVDAQGNAHEISEGQFWTEEY